MYQITDDVAEGDRLSFAGDALVVCARVMVMVFNATSNNISVISWLSVLLVEETGRRKPPTCCNSLTNFIT